MSNRDKPSPHALQVMADMGHTDRDIAYALDAAERAGIRKGLEVAQGLIRVILEELDHD